jgi:hypothetical protein
MEALHPSLYRGELLIFGDRLSGQPYNSGLSSGSGEL